jgi:glycosyltransferase involved in cell wall biosynthesis
MNKRPVLAIVVPCYNEVEVLPATAERLYCKLQRMIQGELISESSIVLFVDDGSTDNTWGLIENYHRENPFFSGIKLSGNRGHQHALLCGLLSIKDDVDVTISIDADLQDDIDVLDEMVAKYLDGCEIVYGVRSNRDTDSSVKRTTAQGFYRFMRSLGANIVYNHADFRLMGRNALESLAEYHEVNLFLRGIVPLLGYKTGVVYYSRKERFAGKSKYPFRKMLHFALEGITSFSIKPLRLITSMGILLFLISISLIGYYLIRYYTGYTITGWATIACSLWGIGGLILFSIGLLGEYIGKIYLETKRRPLFHLEQFLHREITSLRETKQSIKMINGYCRRSVAKSCNPSGKRTVKKNDYKNLLRNFHRRRPLRAE